jgi:hypothetical protein
MLLGSGFLEAIKLMVEVAETKPWLLAYDFSISRSGQQGRKRPLNFETLQVTINLELALGHLRRETRAQTLWIDACVSTRNTKRKKRYRSRG